jgi:hypothetical protein
MLKLSSRAAAGTRKSFKQIKPPMLKFSSRTTGGMRNNPAAAADRDIGLQL